MLEDQVCHTVGNLIMASPGVIHGQGQGMSCLVTDVTWEHLVQACVDGTVLFAPTMLKRGHCADLLDCLLPRRELLSQINLGGHLG